MCAFCFVLFCFYQMLVDFKGCGMGPWLVLVSPCFRENVVATYAKLGLFCVVWIIYFRKTHCSLFWKSNFKMALIWKKGLFLTHFSHFLVTRETLQKLLQQYLTHKHIFCSPYCLFLPYQFWKKIQIYLIPFLFGMSPGVDSHSHHFGTINK